jgi:hypothetical protein
MQDKRKKIAGWARSRQETMLALSLSLLLSLPLSLYGEPLFDCDEYEY